MTLTHKVHYTPCLQGVSLAWANTQPKGQVLIKFCTNFDLGCCFSQDLTQLCLVSGGKCSIHTLSILSGAVRENAALMYWDGLELSHMKLLPGTRITFLVRARFMIMSEVSVTLGTWRVKKLKIKSNSFSDAVLNLVILFE